jgi:hypothetical protein
VSETLSSADGVDTGLGFGAFHHFVYEPFRSGGFASGSRGRVRGLAEVGLAAAFTVHE